MSRSRLIATDAMDLSKRWVVAKLLRVRPAVLMLRTPQENLRLPRRFGEIGEIEDEDQKEEEED